MPNLKPKIGGKSAALSCQHHDLFRLWGLHPLPSPKKSFAEAHFLPRYAKNSNKNNSSYLNDSSRSHDSNWNINSNDNTGDNKALKSITLNSWLPLCLQGPQAVHSGLSSHMKESSLLSEIGKQTSSLECAAYRWSNTSPVRSPS